jgi:hypothetical protein
MSRQPLPPRRVALTFEMAWEPLEYRSPRFTVTAGVAMIGNRPVIREVFASSHKITSAQDIAARDIAILISIALQSGQPLDELCKAMTRDGDGRAQGLAARLCDELLALEQTFPSSLPQGDGAQSRSLAKNEAQA